MLEESGQSMTGRYVCLTVQPYVHEDVIDMPICSIDKRIKGKHNLSVNNDNIIVLNNWEF